MNQHIKIFLYTFDEIYRKNLSKEIQFENFGSYNNEDTLYSIINIKTHKFYMKKKLVCKVVTFENMNNNNA